MDDETPESPMFHCEMSPNNQSPEIGPDFSLGADVVLPPLSSLDETPLNNTTPERVKRKSVMARSHEEDLEHVADRLLSSVGGVAISNYHGRASSAEEKRPLAQSMEDGPVTPSGKKQRKVTTRPPFVTNSHASL